MPFVFSNSPEFNVENELCVVIKNGINNKQELLKEFSEKLFFPDWFGMNWDALYDLLTDLEWINQAKINILHTDLPMLEVNDLKIYLEILQDSLDPSRQKSGRQLTITFPKSEEQRIHQILA